MTALKRLLFWLLAVGGGAHAAAAQESLDGFWMDSHGEVVLEIHKCATSAAYCGRVAWLRLPNGPDGKLLTDYRNPDPALRARQVCGLEVLSGFTKEQDGTWSNGNVYVSDLGMSFSGYAEVVDPQSVKVTGYVVLPLFGQSEVWTKVPKPFTPCWEKTEKPIPPERPLANRAVD